MNVQQRSPTGQERRAVRRSDKLSVVTIHYSLQIDFMLQLCPPVLTVAACTVFLFAPKHNQTITEAVSDQKTLVFL